MISRRAFISSLSASVLTAPLAVEAQQAGRIPRVGFLLPGTQATSASFVDAFRQGLGGYVEGRTILIDYRWAEGKAAAVRSSRASWFG